MFDCVKNGLGYHDNNIISSSGSSRMIFRYLYLEETPACLSVGSEFILALTIHSYGQFFVYPWGYTTDEDPANIDQLVRPNHAGTIVNNDVMRCFDNFSKCTLATEKYRHISFVVGTYTCLCLSLINKNKCNLALSCRRK